MITSSKKSLVNKAIQFSKTTSKRSLTCGKTMITSSKKSLVFDKAMLSFSKTTSKKSLCLA